MTEIFDLIVIGGGRAANLAIAAGNTGLKTALIEKDRLGGTCPNRGCVPSKLLIGFSEAARQVKEADRHFLEAEIKNIDLERVFASVNEYVNGVDGRYTSRIPENVELIRGEAEFIAHKLVSVAGCTLSAEKIVIATGSRPRPAPYSELPVWTSDDLFPLEDAPPRSLLIVGSGFIGCELGAFFSGVGVKTMLLSRGRRLLTKEDEEIEDVFKAEFSRYVQVHYESKLIDLKHDRTTFTAIIEKAGQTTKVQVDKVLFATGRVPNTENLNLGATGLQPDSRGFIPVNDELETGVPGIFAAGDVNGRSMLQHAASFEIKYLRRKFLKGVVGPIDPAHIGHAVYSHPEIASVGLTEKELKYKNIEYISVFEDWQVSARAMSKRIDYARIKLLVSPQNYQILGCHMVGPEADTMLHQVLAVMQLNNDVRELAEMVYIHPALNECILAAAVKAVTKIRALKQGKS